MTNERLTVQWDHTAAVCATIINMHRAKHSKPADMIKLNPFRAAAAREKPLVRLNKKQSMEALKAVFIDHKNIDVNDFIKE